MLVGIQDGGQGTVTPLDSTIAKRQWNHVCLFLFKVLKVISLQVLNLHVTIATAKGNIYASNATSTSYISDQR